MAAFTSKKFSWRQGYSYRVSAEVVGEALENIEQRDGEVTSRSFLDYSRPEESETHSMFEWDDSVAAEKYRLKQAACIINQLEVRLVCEGAPAEDKRVEIVPAFVNAQRKTAPMTSARFVNVVSAMDNDETRDHVLHNALRELRAFRDKYRTVSQFASLFKAVDELIEGLKEDAG